MQAGQVCQRLHPAHGQRGSRAYGGEGTTSFAVAHAFKADSRHTHACSDPALRMPEHDMGAPGQPQQHLPPLCDLELCIAPAPAAEGSVRGNTAAGERSVRGGVRFDGAVLRQHGSVRGGSLYYNEPSVHSVRSQHSIRSTGSFINVTVAEDEPMSEILSIKAAEPPTLRSRAALYFTKWRGGIDRPPPIPSLAALAVSLLGSFIAILVICVVDAALAFPHNFPVLIGSFGASAVLVYGVPESKLAQPRNLIGGQAISAVIGVCVRLAIGMQYPYVTSALGMSLALVTMQLTATTHPPGGATALIACSAPHLAPWNGFQMVVAVTLGSAIMGVLGVLLNNLVPERSYPTYWY